MKKICLVTTYNKTFYLFFYEYIKKLSKNNIVYLVGTDVSKIKKFFPKKIKYYDLKINRRISPLDDLFSLLKLFFFIKKEKIYLTHSIMPKSGLICAIAAYLAKVKYRVHTFTGQVWYQKKNFQKILLSFFDIVISNLNSHILCDSKSQKKFLIKNKIVSNYKINVLSNGSISGIDTNRFKKKIFIRTKIRKKFNLTNEDTVVLFVGRMNYEKGIQELLEAYKQLKIKYKNNLYLFLVGDDEINLKQKIKQKFKNLSIKLFSNSKNIYDFYIASDIYCLPSYREGFSNSVLEAASMELPIIGTNINGIIDIIKNKKNGLLVNVKSKLDLENCLLKLILDKKLRIKYGKNARKDIITKFKKKILIKSFMNYYKKNFYIN